MGCRITGYVVVEPEEIDLNLTLSSLELTRSQLVDLAILVGTDFNPGIKGIGAKTALKLLKKHNDLENILKEKDLEIENFQKIRDIFLKPDVTDDYEVSMGRFSQGKIVKLLVDDYEFSESRVNSALEKVKLRLSQGRQKKLDQWF
jgi:flap endonuclease-1